MSSGSAHISVMLAVNDARAAADWYTHSLIARALR
jgi:hypothetical protein